jgi:ABC-type antimicrobial peptide transport system permease subunit
VAAVIALMSIGQGAQAFITEEINGIGTNLLFVSPGSFESGPVRHAAGSATSLTCDDAKAIADPVNVPDAALVAPQVAQNTQVIFGDANVNVSVLGTTGENGGRVSLTVVGVLGEKGGSMMGSADDTVFVPITTAQTKLFSGRNALGEPIVATVSVVAPRRTSRRRSSHCSRNRLAKS